MPDGPDQTASGASPEPVKNLSFFTVFPSLMLPIFLAVVDQTIVSTALPAIAAATSAVERVSWIVVGYLIAQTIAAPIYGRLGDSFGRIFENSFQMPEIRGVDLNFDLLHERRSAKLESARTDVTEARPGDEVVVEAVLRPYRGERIVRQVPVRVPTSTPQGTLRILVSDGDTLDRGGRGGAPAGRQFDLGSTIALLNKEHSNDRLYVSLLEANPEAMVEDKVMPTLPLSVMNVMDGMRGTQDMVVVGESAVDEASTPLDYEVSGAQVITLQIK